MILIDDRQVSPITAPDTYRTNYLGGNLHDAADRRLTHSVTAHNSVPNVLVQGRLAQPYATSDNPLAVTVENYEAPPGHHLGQSNHLEFQNEPLPRVDQVADALQRFFDISPRREPTADPLDEASVARHPQQILESNSRWEDAAWYQYSDNGVKLYQFTPEVQSHGGRLELKLETPGPADIAAPPTSEAQPAPDPLTLLPSPSMMTTGNPITLERESFMRANLVSPLSPYYLNDASIQAEAAASNSARRLNEVNGQPTSINYASYGAPNHFDVPSNQPAYAATAAIEEMRYNLDKPEPEILSPGPVNIVNNPEYQPDQAWKVAATKASKINEPPLVAARYSNSSDATLDQEAYSRAINMMHKINTPQTSAIAHHA